LTVARSLLEAGAHVHCLDMLPQPDEDAWSKAQQTADTHNVSIKYHQVDVTSQQSLSSVFSEIFTSTSRDLPIKGMYVAAGINQVKPALEYTPEDFRRVIDVNLTGTFFCAQAFAKNWFERNPDCSGKAGEGASVVLTGSMSGHVANAGLLCASYNASKAGVSRDSVCGSNR
jgi:NAD(P)-dependent dehydrogenase (short-subunit alcohol dehydrogenase family)